jgi:peroxiredoxin
MPPMPLAGSQAPEFELPYTSRDKTGTLNLADLKGSWVVLYFYPADGTSVCSIREWRATCSAGARCVEYTVALYVTVSPLLLQPR